MSFQNNYIFGSVTVVGSSAVNVPYKPPVLKSLSCSPKFVACAICEYSACIAFVETKVITTKSANFIDQCIDNCTTPYIAVGRKGKGRIRV